MTAPHLCCAFCRARADEVAFLIKGRTSLMICDLCVEDASALIVEARAAGADPKAGARP
ncbi:MAG TPA: ClpX C4-type zinc finger protein [Caulobacteraceae bacterium]|jgi:hypothetical protein|nr:ClpX C4-type zinc finger protein [Caulobacteraceae bacterium]